MDVYAETDGYEGALVLDPKPGMHFSPVTVLDYNSLYPSSMISDNISPNSIVLDPRYNNLPGYTYNTVKWCATAPACRFAESATEKVILPQILQTLLKERKNTRKKMEYVAYTFKNSGVASIGLIAQNVQQVVPEVVHANPDGFLGVSCGHLVGLLVEGIKDLSAASKTALIQQKALERHLKVQKRTFAARLRRLTSRVTRLEKEKKSNRYRMQNNNNVESSLIYNKK